MLSDEFKFVLITISCASSNVYSIVCGSYYDISLSRFPEYVKYLMPKPRISLLEALNKKKYSEILNIDERE